MSARFGGDTNQFEDVSYATSGVGASTKSKQVNSIARLPNADDGGVAVYYSGCEAGSNRLLEDLPGTAQNSNPVCSRRPYCLEYRKLSGGSDRYSNLDRS